MKKGLFLLFAMLLTAPLFAQGVDLGLKAGINFANITDATGLSNRTGFVLGLLQAQNWEIR
ncbi:MAG: hypothetical protein R2793_08305 [Flavobacteriaceae bacterium]